MSSRETLAGVAATLLEPDDREVVLGDLAEAGEGACQAMLDILGLVIRRKLALWTNWRPWFGAFAVALPAPFSLMGISISISLTCQRLLAPSVRAVPLGHFGLLPLVCEVLLLLVCSWTAGFVVGSISRRTIWVSAALCCSPCLFCLARFRMESLSRLCLFLFLLPAIIGVSYGLRGVRLRMRPAIALAVAATLCMVFHWSSGGFWILDWTLLCPAWYLVATALRPSLQTPPPSAPRKDPITRKLESNLP